MADELTENVTVLEVTKCPVCDANLNAAAPAEGENRPNPGDYSLCLYCGEYLRFTDELKLRSLTTADIVDAPLNELAYMRRMARNIPKKH